MTSTPPEMACGRNKATAVIKEMSAMHMKNLADRMREQPFSVATDGSNDVDRKQFPIVINIAEPNGTVNSELLGIRICRDSATG